MPAQKPEQLIQSQLVKITGPVQAVKAALNLIKLESEDWCVTVTVMPTSVPEATVGITGSIPKKSLNEQVLREALEKFASWFEAQAARNDQAVKTCRFETLNEAYRADAKNYRAMAKDARATLTQGVPEEEKGEQ